MIPKFSSAYWDALYSSEDYSKLAEISSLFCASEVFHSGEPDYGFPQPIFTFVESLLWFAQANRTGVWTYYEATPISRQQAMLSALKSEAPDEFTKYYALGMRDWRDEVKIKSVDNWIKDHDAYHNRWLHHMAKKHRTAIEELCAYLSLLGRSALLNHSL